MRLAISNIAWDSSQDEVIAGLLQRYSIDAIDIAPGKYFPNPAYTSQKKIAHIKSWWSGHGIEISGMQALLFGTTGLNIFGSKESQERMLQHLNAVCRIAAGLAARRLVFGSPKNRDRSGLDNLEARDIAISFFRKLGDIAQSYGLLICLEPNPPCYGSNFMTTSAETAMVVEKTAHPSIRMQMDTGAITINNEKPAAVLQKWASLIGHIHASEPNLLPLGDGGCEHGKIATALRQHLPSHIVSIEMAATKDEPQEISVERALKVAIYHYRGHYIRLDGTETNN